MSKVAESDVAEVEEAPVAPAAVKRKKLKAKAKTNGHKAPVKAKGKAKAAKGKTRKPRTVDPSKLDQFGFRLGSLKARAAAMYAGKKGATLGEVKEKLESTQFNLITELEEKGFKVLRDEEMGDSNRKITRYRILAK